MVIFTPLRQLLKFYQFLVIFLLLFFAENSFGQVVGAGITGIYTDYGGFWKSSASSNSTTKPDNNHNVLGFTWKSTTYSTGVNDVALTGQVAFTAANFQAFPVKNIVLTNTSKIGLGQLKDGVNNGRSIPAPFALPPQVSNFLTDGIQGLDIGTGVINVPSTTPLTFPFGAIINVSQINDDIPDLLISQIGNPVSTSLDKVYFINSSGGMVGNAVSINQTTYPSVGTWSSDQYEIDGTLTTALTKQDRPIRIWAADVAAFGINTSNYLQATALKYELGGDSDPGFLAFNTRIIQIFSANDDAATTNMGTPVNINVLNNDVPSSAIDARSVVITTQPQHGTAVASPTTGIVTYTPYTGYSGPDYFDYKVSNIGNSQNDIAQVTVTVGGPVAAPVFDAGLTSSRCMGAGQNSYTATATNSTGIAYSLSTAAAGTIDPSTGLVTWSATFSGSATITATASGQGGPQTSTYNVMVNPVPAVTSAPTDAICNQNPQNYIITSDVNGATFSWSRQAVPGISNAAVTGQTSNPITETLINTTSAPVNVIYVITPQANGCTGAAFNYTLTVNPIPAAPNASSTPICSGSKATLTASSSSGTYQWYDAETGGTLLSTGASFTTGFLTSNTTFYVQTTVNDCISARRAVTVTVTPIPSTPIANSNSPVCSGMSLMLTTPAVTGATYNWTGPDNFTSNLQNPVIANVTPGAAGTYSLTVTVNSCTSNAGTTSVIINPTPTTPVAGGNTPICAGETINLTASNIPGATYSWIGPNGFTSAVQNPVISNAQVAASGPYTVKATVNGCISAGGTVNITVNSVPAAPTLSSNSPVCATNGLNLMATSIAGASYSWTGPNNFTSNLQNPVIPSATPENSGTYSVTASLNGCISPAASITVTVYPKPALSNTSFNQIICSEGTSVPVQLTSNISGTNFTWTATASPGITGFTASGTTDVIPAQTLTNSGLTTSTVTYTINPFYNGCPGETSTYTINVNPKPVLSNTSFNQVICSEGTSAPVTLTSNVNGTNFTWTATATAGVTGFTTSGNTNVIPAQTLVNTGSIIGTVTYTINPFYNGCPGETSTYTITVNPKPAVTSDASNIICSGNAQAYDITSNVSGTNFTWSRDLVTGISNPAVSGQISNFITEALVNTTSAPIAVVYTIVPSANNCTGTSFTYTITVKPMPVVSSIPSDIICNGLAQSYTIRSNVSGATFTWSRNLATGISNLAVSNQTSNSITETLINTTSAPIAVAYTIIPTANGCTGASFTYTITVNPTPAVTSIPSDVICSGSDQSYNITSNVIGATFSWSRAETTGISNPAVSGQTSNSITEALVNTTSAPIAVVYTIIPKANGCTGASFTYTITVNPTPAVTSLPSDVICNSSAQTYAITSNVSGASFSWSRASVTGISNSAISNQTSNSITETLINTTSAPIAVAYTIVPKANGCIGASFTYTITVKPTPVLSNTSLNQIVCSEGNSVPVQLTSNVSGTNFTWTATATTGITGFTASGTDVIPAQNLVNAGLTAGTVTYTIKPFYNGCEGVTSTYTITVNPKPAVTSAANEIICSGDAQSYNITSNVSGATFSWSRATVTGISNPAVSNQTGSSITEALVNTTSSPISVAYTIVPVANGCNGASFTYTILVNSTPIINSDAGATICNQTPQDYHITSNVSNATFGWSRAAVTGISNAAVTGETSSTITEALVNTTSAPVAVTYVIVPQANNCTGQPFSYTVTVNPTAALSNSSLNQIVCSEESSAPVTLTSNVSGANFTWTATASAGITGYTASGTDLIPAQTLVNAGLTAGTVTYTIKSFYNNCEGVTNTYTITVNLKPTITSAASATICNETPQSYTITSDVTGTTFNWSRAAVAGISNPMVSGQTSNTITETLVNTTSSPIAVAYTIVPEANSCTGASFTYTILVNPTPVINSVLNAAICNQTPQDYHITSNVSGATFSWSRATVAGISNAAVSNQTSNTITETLENTSSLAISVIYTIVPKANGCIGQPFNYTLIVNPTPIITSAATATACSNEAKNYTINSNVSGATFIWSRATVTGISNAAISNQNSNTISEILVNTTSAPITVTYTIVPKANGCIGTAFDYTVTVNPTPVVTSEANASICNKAAQNYPITSNVSGASFSWSRDATTGISNAAVSNQTSSIITENLINTTSAPIAVPYTIVPSANGCTGASFTYTILVNPTPLITSEASNSICNETAQNYIITSNVNNATFTWSRAALTGISNAATSGQTSNVITESLKNTTSTPITVTYTITPKANGCTGVPFQYEVTVKPTVAVTSAGSESICNLKPQNYTITSNVNGAIFSWSRAAVTGISNAAVTAQTGNSITETLENTTSSPIAVAYTIIPQANGCTGESFTHTVTVNPTTTITSDASATICNETAQNYSITSNVSSVTFSWSRAAVAGISNAAVSNQTSNSITESLVNTTSSPIAVAYTIVPAANGCSGASFTYTILVDPTPALSNTSFSQVICSEGSSVPVTLTSNVSGTNFTWIATASPGITGFTASGTGLITAQTLVNTGSTTGKVTYQIKTFYNNCEGLTSTYTINVNPKPATPVASSNSPVCNGTSLKLTTPAVAGATYAWTGPNGFTSNHQNPEIANATEAAQGTYSLTVTVNGCLSDAGTTTVTVNPIPLAPLVSSNGNLCEGETLRLTATTIPGATYLWTGPNGFTSSVQNPVIDRATVAASGNYSVNVTVNGCTSPAASIAVLVNPIPAAAAVSSNSPVCATTNLNLTAASIAGASYSWTGPNGFTSTLQNPVITAATPVNSGTYAVTISVGGCASAASSIKVLVTPLPAEPVLTSNSPVCSGNLIELTSTTFADATYRWTGPNGFTSTQQNPIINNAAIANQGRYTVVITTPGCTVTNTSFIDVKVNQTPNAPVINNNGALCIGQILKLSATTVTGATYSWTGPNSFTSNLQNPEIANVTIENAGEYLLAVTLNGCTSNAARTTVIVNKPSVVLAGNDQTACATNPAVTIAGSISGSSTTGIWSTSGSGTFPAGNTSLKGTYLPSATDVASGNVTLTLTATNTAPCAIASSSFKITFTPTPAVFAGEDQAICSEDQVSLKGKITNGSGGVWSSSGTGTFSPSNNSLTAVYHPSEKDRAKRSILLTLTASGNCAIVFDQVNINLIPAPKVSAGNDIYIMEGEKITLQAAAIGTELKYNWTPNLYLDNATSKNPVLTGTQDITYTLTVTGTAGCVAQDQVVVKVLKPIIIPNTFTPNGDGINDTWGIKELINYPDVTVKIFNRYGIQLFYSQGYGTPWDGTFDGQQLPVGTYYYIIDLKTYGKLRSGPVTIIR
jgi:gliding motility-associated-like protein